jgi:hypothetical protein
MLLQFQMNVDRLEELQFIWIVRGDELFQSFSIPVEMEKSSRLRYFIDANTHSLTSLKHVKE